VTRTEDKISNAPSERQLEMLQRVAREEGRDRRTIMRVQVLASVVLLASTLVAWENHWSTFSRRGEPTQKGVFTHRVARVAALVGSAGYLFR